MITDKFIVRNAAEATDCSWCACPLDTGDTVFLDQLDRPYCGKGCERNLFTRENETIEAAL